MCAENVSYQQKPRLMKRNINIIFFIFTAIYLCNMFGFNITPEAIVGPIITWGARWVVKNI